MLMELSVPELSVWPGIVKAPDAGVAADRR
jgi:hypothetical protein